MPVIGLGYSGEQGQTPRFTHIWPDAFQMSVYLVRHTHIFGQTRSRCAWSFGHKRPRRARILACTCPRHTRILADTPQTRVHFGRHTSDACVFWQMCPRCAQILPGISKIHTHFASQVHTHCQENVCFFILLGHRKV